MLGLKTQVYSKDKKLDTSFMFHYSVDLLVHFTIMNCVGAWFSLRWVRWDPPLMEMDFSGRDPLDLVQNPSVQAGNCSSSREPADTPGFLPAPAYNSPFMVTRALWQNQWSNGSKRRNRKGESPWFIAGGLAVNVPCQKTGGPVCHRNETLFYKLCLEILEPVRSHAILWMFTTYAQLTGSMVSCQVKEPDSLSQGAHLPNTPQCTRTHRFQMCHVLSFLHLCT
jgi:hypothetical protein